MKTIQSHNLYRTQPSQKWTEGIPTGNGTLGSMAWGGPAELILSLDRTDLWWTEGKRRITAGALVLSCGSGSCFEEGLNLADAVAYRVTGRRQFEWFVHANEPVLGLRIASAPGRFRFHWRPPELWSRAAAEVPRYCRQLEGKPRGRLVNPHAGCASSARGVAHGVAFMRFLINNQPRVLIGVRACQRGETIPIRRQGDGFEVAARAGDELLLLVSVWSLERHPETGLESAIGQLAVRRGDWSTLLAGHRRWWREFWSRSGLRLSNPILERLWYRGLYQLGCICRPNSLPIGLQGVWGLDGVPPWNGAYTWNLNVQTCYWPIYTGNHLELGHSLYDWYAAKLPALQELARRTGGEGAAICLQSDDRGVPTLPVGSHLNPADGAWVCHNFWQHFVYTQDREFLRNRCLPVFREHLKFQRSRWRKGADHRYHLAPASSPEIESLATPQCPCRDSAYEIAFGKFLAGAYRQTAWQLRLPADDLSAWARDFSRNVVPYPTARTHTANGYWPEDPAVPDFFVEWPGLETQMSHRHFSHLVMLYPLGEIHRFSPYRRLRTARNALHMAIVRGSGVWVGFSFPWASLLATRLAWPRRMPAHMLETFARNVVVAFNGLTLNEDYLRLGTICQTGSCGPFQIEDFSIESSMMAVTAVQEMLVHAAGGQLVVAGGVPPELDGEFHGLRSPFGDLVSGTIEGGQLVSGALTSERSHVRPLFPTHRP